MAEDVIRFVLRALGSMLVDGLLFVTARLALPLLTLGRWRVSPLNDRKAVLAWHGFKRQPDGTMLVGFTPAILFGLAIWFLIGIFLFAALSR
jgi:hypothetical protein